MKTKMKMKNNRMLLALVMVAALAMVSVAGVAVISDESDAATSTQAGDVVINDKTAGIDYNLFVEGAVTTSTVTIAKEFTYSGTIQFGKLDRTTNVFTPLVTLMLKDASNVVISWDGASAQVKVETIPGADTMGVTAGDIKITLGSMQLGETWYFTGKASGNSVTIDAVNIKGLTVKAGTIDTVAGTVDKGTQIVTPAGKAAMTISGKASMGETSMAVDVKTIIAEGAQIDIGATIPTGSAVIAVSGLALYAQATGTDGKVVTATITDKTVTFNGLNLNDTYKVIMVSAGATNVYSGTLTFTGAVATYTESMTQSDAIAFATASTSKATATALVGIAAIASPTGLTYWSATQDIVLLKNLNTPAVTYTAIGDAIALSAAPADKDVLFVLMKDKSTGALTAYSGAMTFSTNITALATNTVTGVMAASASAPAAAADFKTGTVTPVSVTVTVANSGNMTINGTVNVLYTNINMTGSLTSTGSIKVNGTINYGVAPSATPSIMLVTGVEAAYYLVNAGTAAAPTSTYIYTTLPNAMKSASVITVLGNITILEDMTLTGTSATKNTVTFKGNVTIGQFADATKSQLAINAKLTVPTTVDMVLAGTMTVTNGQVVYQSAKAPVKAPIADVLITDTAKMIYADLATGLGLVKSGETLTLIKAAELKTDATIATGVTLVDAGKALTVADGAKLTIAGTFTSTGITTINGTVIVSGTATFNTGTSVVGATGTLKVLVGGTVSVASAATTTFTASSGTIVVEGTFINGTKSIVATTTVKNMTVTGKLVNNGTSTITVSGSFIFGTAPSLMSDLKNTATITGKVVISNEAYALVYGTSSFTASANISGKMVSTAFTINGSVYATEYALENGTTIKVLNASELKDFKLTAWYDAPVSGQIVSANTGKTIGATGYTTLYGSVVAKQYTLTLTFTEGVTWIFDNTAYANGGMFTLTYGQSYTLNAVAANGYEGTVSITMPGLSSGKFTATGDVTATASGVSPVKEKDGGLNITEILLIILVVIIALLAIIVVFKMLRS